MISRSLHRKFFVAILLVTLSASGCSAPIIKPDVRGEIDSTKTVFFINYGMHSAIVLERSDIPTALVPEVMDFPAAEHLEFGWGDRDYYQATDPGIGLALKAAFLSGGSVLHVIGFKGGVKEFFGAGEIVEIKLSPEALLRLVKFIGDSFIRERETLPAEARPGLFANSRFYPATGRFHIFRTCNTWVANAFHAAGLPIRPALAFTAGNLSRQVKQFGVQIR